MELVDIYDSIIRRGGVMLTSENERLGQIFCNLLTQHEEIPEEEREIFDKIFDLMLNYS